MKRPASSVFAGVGRSVAFGPAAVQMPGMAHALLWAHRVAELDQWFLHLGRYQWENVIYMIRDSWTDVARAALLLDGFKRSWPVGTDVRDRFEEAVAAAEEALARADDDVSGELSQEQVVILFADTFPPEEHAEVFRRLTSLVGSFYR